MPNPAKQLTVKKASGEPGYGGSQADTKKGDSCEGIDVRDRLDFEFSKKDLE